MTDLVVTDGTVNATEPAIALLNSLDAAHEKLDRILAILEPVEPFLASLPELAAKVAPVMDGLATSPVLRMLGVRL